MKQTTRPTIPVRAALKEVERMDAKTFNLHRTRIHRAFLEAIIAQGGLDAFSTEDMDMLDRVDKWLCRLSYRNGSDAHSAVDQIREAVEVLQTTDTLPTAREFVGPDGFTDSQRKELVAGAVDTRLPSERA